MRNTAGDIMLKRAVQILCVSLISASLITASPIAIGTEEKPDKPLVTTTQGGTPELPEPWWP